MRQVFRRGPQLPNAAEYPQVAESVRRRIVKGTSYIIFWAWNILPP